MITIISDGWGKVVYCLPVLITQSVQRTYTAAVILPQNSERKVFALAKTE